MKRYLALILTLLLMCSIVLSSALAEDVLTLNLKEATDDELAQAADLIKAEQRARLKTKVVLDPAELTVNKGATQKIAASVVDLPEGVTADKKFTWTTSDEAVATVNNGSVKGVAPGTARITCTNILSDGTEVSAECLVTVIVMVQGITLQPNKLEIMATETFVPTFAIKPDDATNPAVTYESADDGVVKVTEDGQLYAVAAGKTTITVTAADGSGKNAKLSVTVTKKIGKYDDELTYQGLAWGSGDEECANKLKELGIINPEHNYGAYSSSYCYFWPENELLFASSTWNDLPVIFQDKNLGTASMSISLEKSIGGFNPSNAVLYFTNGFNADGNVDPDIRQLAGVYFYFDNQHDPGPTIFKTLLTKMEEQYGEFTRYLGKDFTRSYYKENYAPIAEIMKGAKVYKYREIPDIYLSTEALCILHGKNNTGIMLSMDTSGVTRLYYGKTDVWDQLREIQANLEANKEIKDDGGI